jgi:hypothetical protein
MSDRIVKIGIVPETPTRSRLGVSIARAGDTPVVIAADEARTLACGMEDEDPQTAAKLRSAADDVEKVLHKPQLVGQVRMVEPKITGPDALRDWVRRYRDLFRGAFRSGLEQGSGKDVVVWAAPPAESLDDPPAGFKIVPRAEARRLLDTELKSLRGSLDDRAGAGLFYVLASREGGRFKGTFVGMLPVPAAGEHLPPAIALDPPGGPDRN